MRKIKLGIILFVIISNYLFSQEILTADKYFEKASAKFGNIIDYEASITITQDDMESKGTVIYKRPHLLRINFTNPAEQVLVVNEEKLIVYIPKYQVILEQEMSPKTENTLRALAMSQGFNFLRDNYSVAYESSPDPIPLEEGSLEKVTKLKFVWRNIKEGFREIIIAFNEAGLIRRIIGKQAITNKSVQIDYKGIIMNQGFSNDRFAYDSPPIANVYGNFLFEEN